MEENLSVQPGGPVLTVSPLSEFSTTEGQGKMIALANEFKRLWKDREARHEKPWVVTIGPGRHLTIEAWQYIGERAGLVARTVETRDVRHPVTGDYEGTHAVAEVHDVHSGRVLGRAEQACFADEVVERKGGGNYPRWQGPDGRPIRHAILGMAQTRAQSRALASVLRFIAELAGASGTPADEMPPRGEVAERPPIRPPVAKAQPAPAPPIRPPETPKAPMKPPPVPAAEDAGEY